MDEKVVFDALGEILKEQHYLAISPEDFHKAYANAKRQNDG